MVRVVTNEEAEAASFVVCCREGMPTVFSDNMTGTCCDCGHAVFFRPYMPTTPPRICIECIKDRLSGGTA